MYNRSCEAESCWAYMSVKSLESVKELEQTEKNLSERKDRRLRL